MKATETLLYKALAPKIRRQDRKEFARMLGMAIEAGARPHHLGGAARDLYSAFSWSRSPQGYDYWATLHYLLTERDA